MKRPGGVTAGVIVTMFGSMAALMLAAAAVASLFIKTPPGGQAPPIGFLLFSALMFTVLAGVGVWTAAGLFQLRPRARTSIQVLAIFVAIGSALFLLMIAIVRPGSGISNDAVIAGRIGAGVMFGVPLAVSLWILFQFNTAATKAAFASGEAVDPSPRPVSITFLACSNFLNIPAFLAGVLTHNSNSTFLFGLTLPVWAAYVYTVALVVLSFYVGKGLLDLRERARLIALGWAVFSLANSLVVFVPPVRRRLLTAALIPTGSVDTAFPFTPEMFLNVFYGAFAIGWVVTIWLLEHHRDTFLRAENARYLDRSAA
jgi:hypothetical protein